jgi:hypothetical protein
MTLSDGTIISSPIKLLTRPRAVYGKPDKEGKADIVGAYFIFNGNKLYFDEPNEAMAIHDEIAEKIPQAEMPKKDLGDWEAPHGEPMKE